MTGKATLAKPAKHIPAHAPAGHADGQFGCGAEGASSTLARGGWTTHQMVPHLRRSRQRPEMMIAVVAHVHETATNRTQAVLHIEYNPFECRPRRPTIRHGSSIPRLKSVEVDRQEPPIAYAQYSVPNYSSLWTDRSLFSAMLSPDSISHGAVKPCRSRRSKSKNISIKQWGWNDVAPGGSFAIFGPPPGW